MWSKHRRSGSNTNSACISVKVRLNICVILGTKIDSGNERKRERERQRQCPKKCFNPLMFLRTNTKIHIPAGYIISQCCKIIQVAFVV